MGAGGAWVGAITGASRAVVAFSAYFAFVG